MSLLLAFGLSGVVALAIAAGWVAWKLDRCLTEALRLGE
jgi:hypothetical protein